MKNDSAIAFLNLGMLALHGGHDNEAVRFFKSVLESKPGMVEAYIGMGLAYSRMAEHVEMVEVLRRAIQIDRVAVRRWAKSSIPDPHMWLSTRPEYAHISGKMAEFLRKQDEADALARLAAAHLGAGVDMRAVTALEYCLELAPDYEAGIILLTIAYLLLEANEPGVAAKNVKKSMLRAAAPKLVKAILRK